MLTPLLTTSVSHAIVEAVHTSAMSDLRQARQEVTQKEQEGAWFIFKTKHHHLQMC